MLTDSNDKTKIKNPRIRFAARSEELTLGNMIYYKRRSTEFLTSFFSILLLSSSCKPRIKTESIDGYQVRTYYDDSQKETFSTVSQSDGTIDVIEVPIQNSDQIEIIFLYPDGTVPAIERKEINNGEAKLHGAKYSFYENGNLESMSNFNHGDQVDMQLDFYEQYLGSNKAIISFTNEGKEIY